MGWTCDGELRCDGRAELVTEQIHLPQTQTIELNAGQYDGMGGDRPYHSLSIWADPVDDGFPRLVLTDLDLFAEGLPARIRNGEFSLDLSRQ